MATKLRTPDQISFYARSLYRRLWRAGEASVLYSRPAVKYVHQRIREGFEEYRHEVDKRILNDLFERAENTIEFLKTSSRRKGLEHRVIYTLCQMTYIENEYKKRPPYHSKRLKPALWIYHQQSYDEYYRTLTMMNDSLKLCLR
ncbi:16955_t:CDS:2 [Cetraspora pellucida]|uniref:16955_t:CDS:1 n=1 Tax=Cetraspora pellucida TaxID=1433469 RepID=A0A9N9HMY4_9GLOM|nr:16955_t:CDS:2 [Cetraspora pellucida]